VKLFNRTKRLDDAANKAVDRLYDKLTGGVSLAEKDVTLRTPYLRSLLNLDEDNEKVTDAYSQSPAVYAAIRAKATNVAQVPFEVYLQGGEDPIESGPIHTLFDNPNANLSKYELWEGIVTWMDLRGHAPIMKDDEERQRVPIALSLLNPDSATFNIVDGLFAGISYKQDRHSEPMFIRRDRLILPKYFNPRHPVKGMAPLEAARLGIENDYQAVLYNREFFKRGSAPGTVYTTDESLGEQQYERLREELIESRRGHHHRDLLLDGGVKAMPHITNKDMEYLQLRRYSLEEIARVFRVPKTELMQYEDINFATALSADLSFWKKTLIPLMRLIESAFNRDLLNPLGYEGRFNINAIDVLNAEILEKAQAAKTFYEIGWSKNDINERLGLGFKEEEDKEAALLGATEDVQRLALNGAQIQAVQSIIQSVADGLLPAESAVELILIGFPSLDEDTVRRLVAPVAGFTPSSTEPEPEPVAEPTQEERSVKELPNPLSTDMALSSMREVKWHSVTNRLRPTEGKLRKEVRSYFKRVRNQLFNRLVKGSGRNAEVKAIPTEPRDALEWVDDILSDAEVRQAVRPYMMEAAGLGFDSVEVDVPFGREARANVDERIVAAVSQRVTKIGRINETVREDVKQSIRDAIQQGIEEGLPMDQRAGLVFDKVGHSLDNAESRVGTIARTETFAAFADGREEVYKIAKPVGLRWITSRDDRVRDAHIPLDGKTVRYGEEFKPGLKRPHDPDADPSETINCRCITTAIFNEDELDG